MLGCVNETQVGTGNLCQRRPCARRGETHEACSNPTDDDDFCIKPDGWVFTGTATAGTVRGSAGGHDPRPGERSIRPAGQYRKHRRIDRPRRATRRHR
ncbi:hypothetical protein DESC_880001 [Desulfosarcina cetonica]|nr:hypothetical protein DESC_880001 [Desulfosarcina cetonica]